MSRKRIFPRNLKPGQRVKASFDGGPERLGVISGEGNFYLDGTGSYPVQFEPCGCHWNCYEVYAFGDDKGWTEQEYRIARESQNTIEGAFNVERERQERYPGKPFSPLFNEWAERAVRYSCGGDEAVEQIRAAV